MWEDEILDEIHKIREEMAKSFNYDIKAIGEDLRRRQTERGAKLVTLESMLKRKAKQEENAKQEEVIQTK